MAVMTTLSSRFYLADIFSHLQTESGTEVFVPSDFSAQPGQTGEILLYAGDNFPTFAKNDVVGVTFDLDWNADQVEFLGAIKDGTIFDSHDFEVSLQHKSGAETARITIWTSAEKGIAVDRGDVLAKVTFFVKERNVPGDEILFPISNAEIAYDARAPRSHPVKNLQSGKLIIGIPQNAPTYPGPDADFYFLENILVKPDSEKNIVLYAAKDTNISGFVFDLFTPHDALQFLEATTVGTTLEGKGFEILTDTERDHHTGVLAATSNLSGVIVKKGEPLLSLTFLVPKIALGTKIPLEIQSMQTTDADLNIFTSVVPKSSILVSEVSALEMLDALPLSSTTLELFFSREISRADIEDFTFTPDLFNDRTVVDIHEKSVVFRKLTTMIPRKIYRIEGSDGILSPTLGSLSENGNFTFFSGFPEGNPVSRFFLESAVSTGETTAVLQFSDLVSVESIEAQDFAIDGMTVLAAEKTGENEVTLTTSPQSAVSGTVWLTIANRSNIHDLRSESEELLSLNVIPFTPFALASNGPQVVSAIAEKRDILRITFDKPLLGSSLLGSSFSLVEQGSSIDLIRSTSFFDLSLDHKEVTFHQVRTEAGKNYLLQVGPGTLQENGNDQEPITPINNMAALLGQGSFTTPWDFYLESAEPLSKSSLRLVFHEDLSDQDLSPLDFVIRTRDSFGVDRDLAIESLISDGKTVILATEVQDSDRSYTVFIEKEDLKNIFGEPLGVPSGRQFFGFSSENMRVTSLTPKQGNLNEETKITISGIHFSDTVLVRLGSYDLDIVSRTETEIVATVPSSLPLDAYDLVVSTPEGEESRLPNAFVVVDPAESARLAPVVLNTESYASPFRVPNDGSTSTMLWARIEDPRGVSDIEKVTADLRQLDQSAAVRFEQHDFVDNKAWYKLEVTIPPTVTTSLVPQYIPITVENKSGEKAFGNISLLVTRDITSSIPPQIVKATASPNILAPGDTKEVKFQVEITDEDGGNDIARVILDASEIGIGVKILKPLPEFESNGSCALGDYILGPWSECSAGTKRRTVDLRSGTTCNEVPDLKPTSEQTCDARSCASDDWEGGEWSACTDGSQSRTFHRKSGALCDGDPPAAQTQSCTISWKDFFLPTAHAAGTTAGKRLWFESDPHSIPSWVQEGTYQLPVTVVDNEGMEAQSTITLTVSYNNANEKPVISGDTTFVSPRRSAINDGVSEFQIVALVNDPNGHEDITSVSVNLAPIGLPPAEMTKGQIVGRGAWYSTGKIAVPRNVIPGFRTLDIAATDANGNVGVYGLSFRVDTPETSGDGPAIPIDRAYTNPRQLTNDESTFSTLYIFVEEGDAPIHQVSVNLGTIGKYKISSPAPVIVGDDEFNNPVPQEPNIVPEESPSVGAVPNCESTETFGCFLPSATEGSRGRWYYLPNVTIRKNIVPSPDPYFVTIVATDIDGRKKEAEMPLHVGDGTLSEEHEPPHLVSVVATKNNEIQALFSSAIDPRRIQRNAFAVTFFDDIHSRLPIQNIDIQSDGRLVTITTGSMYPGQKMTLFADYEALGLKQNQQNSNQLHFNALDDRADNATRFALKEVKALKSSVLSLKLAKPLRFSSLASDGSNFKILRKGTDEELPVTAAKVGKSAEEVLIGTAVQRSGTTYILYVSDLLDASGNGLQKGRNILSFNGFVSREDERKLRNQADFNQDGSVDFVDFTVFSSVYGRTEGDDISASDLNADGKIDFLDFTIFAQQYGKAPLEDTNEENFPEDAFSEES